LSDKPIFKEIAADFLKFINEASVLAHNASFDIGFLNHELANEKMKIIGDEKVIDTLKIARNKHPGMPNNLDALCKRYNVAEQKRGLHDAKSDCDLLAQVYIELIGGRQRNFKLNDENIHEDEAEFKSKKIIREKRASLSLTQKEINEHRKFIKTLGGKVLWNGKEG
jgi:DNA polymerase-3 subunit epsilon